MKALWKGYIILGQFGIPVSLYSATQDSGIKFVQLHEEDSSPVERRLFCKAEGHEINHKEVVKGVEVEPGKYVTFTTQELERRPEAAAKAIEIRQFCLPSQVDLAYFEKPYYIVPSSGGEQAYSVFREGLLRTDMLALGRYFHYGNEHIGAIKASGDILMLHRLRFVSEVIPRSEIKTPPLPRPTPNEIHLMSSVIELYSGPLHLRDYHDEYTEHIQNLVEQKRRGLPPQRRRSLPSKMAAPRDIESTLNQIIEQSDV